MYLRPQDVVKRLKKNLKVIRGIKDTKVVKINLFLNLKKVKNILKLKKDLLQFYIINMKNLI